MMPPLSLAGGAAPRPMEVLPYRLNAEPGDQDLVLHPQIGKGMTPIAAAFTQGHRVGHFETLSMLATGFFDGTDNLVVAANAEDGADPTNAITRAATDACLVFLRTDETTPTRAAGVTLIPNGVRINISQTPGGQPRGACLLFFDPDGAAKVDTFASHGTVDTAVTVTPGIPTDLLLSLSPHLTANWFDDAAKSDAVRTLGFALKNGDQCGYRHTDADGASTTDVRARTADLGAVMNTADGAGIEYGNFTATQFDATSRVTGAGGTVGYLALSMPNAKFWTGVIDTPTSPGAEPYTAPGFRASSLIQVGTILGAHDSEATDRTAESLGAGGATEAQMWGVNIASRDGAPVSDTETRNNVRFRGVGADGFHRTVANQFRPLNSGFRLDFQVTHTAALKWPVLAIGRA